jgi:phosphoglycerate dehydrogenase-like enzyme
MSEELVATFFPDEQYDRLSKLGKLQRVDVVASYAETLRSAEVVITGWGAPCLDEQALAAAPNLMLLAHTGASVKPFVSAASWERGVRVTQAGAAMAESVAERALAMTLALLHRIPHADHVLRTGGTWDDARLGQRHEIAGACIGIVGASRTGRAYARMVAALGAAVQIYDPYLTQVEADELEVQRVDLHLLLSSSLVVALHAPVTDETKGMLGGAELSLIPDGAVLINTARADLLDSAALLRELASGRLDAGFDVYDAEPLGVEHPLRSLPNVVLTPHTAGNTVESRHRAGQIIIDEIERFREGRPLQHEVTADQLPTIG